MTVKSANLSVGVKPKRGGAVSKKTCCNSTSSILEQAQLYLDLDASFSYGSSDEEDANVNANAVQKRDRQNIKMNSSSSTEASGYTSSSSSNSFSKTSSTSTVKKNKRMTTTNGGRYAKITVSSPSNVHVSNKSRSSPSKFQPLSQKEKMKRASKLMKQRQEQQEPPVSPHLTLADLVKRGNVDGKKLYSNSWRSRNNSNKSLLSEEEAKSQQEQSQQQERDQADTFRDNDKDSRGLLDCILSAITSGGGCMDQGKNKRNESDTDASCGDGRIFLMDNNDDASSADKSKSTVFSSHRESSTISTASNSTTSEYVENLSALEKYTVPAASSPDDLLSTASSTSPQKQQEGRNGGRVPFEPVTIDTCIDAIQEEEWNTLLKMITQNPSLMTQQSSNHRNKNLLHILSGQHTNVPTIVAITMINLCPNAVSQPDYDGCIPLHHMVFTGRKEHLVRILLESWSEGTTVRNVDGDLPLHVSVWAGRGNEKVAELLIDAYPQAVGEINNAAGTPLHLACCETNASPVIVGSIIETQLALGVSFNTFDNNGNTPLHVAIKTRAPLDVVKKIHSELGPEPFGVADRNKVYPLQMAMSIKNIDPEVVHFVCKADPRIMKKQMTNGMMPVRMAAEQNMPPKIVKELLLADSPVKFMPLTPQLRDVVLRIHSQSWWHLTTVDGRYAAVIDDILTNMASIHEIVSICQEPDLNGYSSVFERSHGEVRRVMTKNLIFCERYHVAPEYKASVVKGLLLLCAIDKGGGQQLNHAGVPLQENREVLLHCCVKGSNEYSQLVEEIRARENFNFSHLHSQQLYDVHNLNAKQIGCSGDMLCLAFERPLLTLLEIFETSRFRKRKNQQWARKSLNLLLSLARVLKYFHTAGYVHGSVEPATIGKFQGSNNWKMLDMRRATQIGKPMRGELRYGAPPESVSASQMKAGNPEVVKLVSFDENFVRGTVPSKYPEPENETSRSLEFSPSQCFAATSWDIWSFGLIMGQLVLGQSMVLLPNFEKASDAHLKNLHQYNDSAVKKIYNAATRVSGVKAADLLKKLLQPRPEDRPQTMDEVLSHVYFATDDVLT